LGGRNKGIELRADSTWQTPEPRKRDSQAELGEKLAERQKRDLVNQVWGEALALIDNPWLRVTGKKRTGEGPQATKRGSKWTSELKPS
jgi:hypothetical protein